MDRIPNPDIDSLTVTDGVGRRHLPVIGRYKLPQMRREFPVNKPVRRATAYVCGLGLRTVHSTAPRPRSFSGPGRTKFDKEAQYVSFDVTDRLKQGKKRRRRDARQRFFNIPNERYTKFVGSYGAPKMLLKMEIEYEDGTSDTIVSDASWKTTQSPITFSSIYGGEDFDANLVQQGWKEAGFDDSGWQDAVLTKFDSPLRSQRTTPLKIRQALPTVRK